MKIHGVWNESQPLDDPVTGRPVRRLTTTGRINQTPTYHTNSGFSADGRFLVFASVREGATWVLRAEVETGELKALWRAPGVGDRNYIHRGMGLTFPDVDGRGICGNRVCIAPESGLAVFTCERQVIAVDIETCDARVLLDDCGEEWIFGAPCVSPDEEWVAIALSSAHPQALAGEPITRNYKSYPDHRLRLIRIPMDGSGETEILYEHEPAQSAHCAFCPTDGNLLYFDLDLPPHYWGGGDGVTPRIWLLDLATREARPLKENYPGPFQTHTAWLWDGSALAYHGSLPRGGVYLGITRTDGETVWEREFPDATSYGHLTPDAKRSALILDGDFSTDLLQWLYYDEATPRLEPICRHATEWRSIPGQYSHPHPLTDASGRWVSFTAAHDGRSDVYVVDTS
ncbi:MAG TPA: oligogalacturonate lyase family protein [Planctomycetota bacterium]|nr:oligogalacturonate lyase family protein [Planctomycetota bacterium]